MTPIERDHLIRFWIGQDSEHQLFYILGLTDPALKAEASQLRDEYEVARATGNYGFALENILPRSQAFKMKGRDASLRGFVGWIYPLFWEHTHRELEMFQRQIAAGVAERELLCFWNQIGAEHCEFAQQLLDPTENSLQVAAVNAASRAMGIANQCHVETMATLKAISKNSGTEIDKLVGTLVEQGPKIRSIIHPALGMHVLREGKEFLRQINGVATP